MRRRLLLGTAVALCVVGVVVIAIALIGSFPGPGEQGQAHTQLMVTGLAITAVGGVLIGWTTFSRPR
jgi:hypothetical protein